jgi:hypothetical protein
MAAQDLLEEEEAAAAEIGIVHTDVTSFRAGSIGLDVTRDRFAAETTDATAFEALRDLVTGVFGQLPHTPVAALGINRSAHYQMPSVKTWNDLGHLLVPKGPWEPVLSRPGTRSVTVEGIRPDAHQGFIRIQFEPSLRVAPFGVYFAVNDHYQLSTGEKNLPASEAVNVIRENWDSSLSRADSAIAHLLSLV